MNPVIELSTCNFYGNGGNYRNLNIVYIRHPAIKVTRVNVSLMKKKTNMKLYKNIYEDKIKKE